MQEKLVKQQVISLSISASRINKMKIFFYLILSMITGCESTSQLKTCVEGWVELRCAYPTTNRRYKSIEVVTSQHKIFEIKKEDVWERKDRFHLYNDTKNKTARVVIKQLEKTDGGNHSIGFNNRTTCTVNLQIEGDKRCQTFSQTAYKTVKTTITCNPRKNVKDKLQFFSKVNGSDYDEIVSTKKMSNRRFTLTNSNFSISISNVSTQDAGVYWCGVNSKEGNYRAFRKIQLKVETITNFTRSAIIGQNFSYWCKYPSDAFATKLICKGEDPSTCQPIVTTNSTTNKRFYMNDNKAKKNITIRLTEVRADEARTYWCGAESTDNRRSNMFFNRLSITVVTPTSTSTQSTTVSTTVSATNGPSPNMDTKIICVALLLLFLSLFVLVLILIYKRFSHSNTRNRGAAQHNREDCVYEEMQESLQKAGTESAVMTIYSTANFPTNPSDSLCYSTINFQKSSDKPGGEALVLNPSSTACEYATVNYSRSPTYSTLSQPSTSTDPLYSTVNKTKQGKISPVRKL